MIKVKIIYNKNQLMIKVKFNKIYSLNLNI